MFVNFMLRRHSEKQHTTMIFDLFCVFLHLPCQIQLLSSLDLKKTPQLLELVEGEKVSRNTRLVSCSFYNIFECCLLPAIIFIYYFQDVEELMSLAPEKVVLKWMNFHLKKAGYEKEVTNFSSDLKVRDKFVKIQSQWKCGTYSYLQ